LTGKTYSIWQLKLPVAKKDEPLVKYIAFGNFVVGGQNSKKELQQTLQI